MTPAWRHRSTSLAVRLLALAAVPVVALLVLGSQRIASEKRLADQASHVVDLVERQHAVAAAYPPAQSERIALEGLARIDAAGISRDTVVGLIGIDLEAANATNARTLDQALDDLNQRYRSIELADGELLGDRLGLVRGNLAAQRDLSRDALARTADVRQVFDELFAVLEETLRSADPLDGAGNHIERRIQLDALASVLTTAGDHGDALLRTMVDASPEIGLDVATTLAIHESSLDQLESSLDDVDLVAFAEVRARLGERAEIVPLTSADTGDAAVAEQVTASAAAIFGHLEYVGTLQAFSDDFHLGVADSLQDAADSAASRATHTEFLLWSIGVLTSLLTVLVLVSILLPIRRLRRRAETISNGELDLEVLPLQGPSDVRALTATTNDMLSTLHRVNDDLSNLASGRLDAVSPDLPGAVGVALRESVERLADVTAELQRSQRLSSAIVTQAADAIWTLDQAGRVRAANEASSELTGVPIADQIGRYITEFLSQTDGEATVRVPSGPQPKVLVARSDIDVGHERVTAIIAHDISERSRFEERLTYQAHHDALTGLPNRFALLQHLEHLVVTHADDVAVLFVDLDAFKSVNDTQGHAVGDRVLTDVAATLSRTVRDGEFVGRLGGDEFVVIARNFAQPADVIALGHRIIREVEQPHQHSGQIFVLSASVGVAIPTPGTSALDTIRQADNAVYQAKRRGRGRVELFDATMQERIEREAELELALRHAVRNDELRVHLQPVVDLTSGEIGGAEALVRWERPGHGLVPPADFIPVAERSSLIFEVERWVLTAVCERLAEWRRWDPDTSLRIAVNIAGRHLIEGDLIADVDAALSLTGADPGMLELELTESQLLEDLEHATTVLDSLRKRGISIAVDDFGTGYSSMTYLRHLPIDAVKIDRSFVARATEHGYDSTVIEALLTIGRTLELDVVAEGVETDDQLEFVRARGCDRAQGFLLARPMPVGAAERIIFGGRLASAAAHAGV